MITKASSEDFASSTAYTSTYHGTSGSVWEQYSTVPVNYQDSAGAWHKIDATLHPDPDVAGGLVSGANSWQVHFAPLSATTAMGRYRP